MAQGALLKMQVRPVREEPLECRRLTANTELMNSAGAGKEGTQANARAPSGGGLRTARFLLRTLLGLAVTSAMLRALRGRCEAPPNDSAMVPGSFRRGCRPGLGAPSRRPDCHEAWSSRGAASEAGQAGTPQRPAPPAAMPTPFAVSLPRVAPAPRSGPLQTAAAAAITPVMLLALMLISPLVKDAEAAVVRPLPARVLRVLRQAPLTWELFSAWEFAVTVAAVAAVRPELCCRFLADDGLAELRYGSRPEQTLLLFEAGSSKVAQPLVVFVHGGSWSHSRHWMYRLIGRRFAAKGFATAVIGYGQYPSSTVREMVSDVSDAVDWLRRGGRRCIDPSRVFLLGHSSGGHLCTLAALAGGCVGLSGMAALSSPMDIADHYAWEQGRGVADISALHPAHGGEANFAAFSPTRLVRGLPRGAAPALMPPLFIGHGTEDWTVPPEASERFVDAFAGAGGEVVFRRWEGLGHFSILGALMGFPVGAEADAAAEDLEVFMHRCLADGKARGASAGPGTRMEAVKQS
uniref:BD-FAE-like domain-containing protein n=2 Tax=Alexandrium monilatum TaxID=311494 RepID=A0A7S4VQH0_9DINO